MAAFLPEFIFSAVSFTPTILYHILCLLLLILLIDDSDKINGKTFLIGFLLVLLMYIRPEFALYITMLFVYFLYKKLYKKSLSIFLILLLCISPWIIRNYVKFEQFTFTTNFGLNFYRGNNPEEIGSWGNEEINHQITNLNSKNLEVELNRIYIAHSLNYIKKNPIEAAGKSFIKLFQFWIFNYNDNRSYNFLYLIPHFFIIGTFFFGFIKSFNYSRFKFIYCFLIYSSLVAMIFFPMARYQTMMKVVPIIFSGYFISEAFSKKTVQND
jgi:hypothetical protein